ncbi:MAG TPA: hypothetical protein VFK70_15915, partial [Vicinamibacteria bacterium]|nr:hypothetical protein [Vicinamibacteria bacterium]
MLPSPDTEHAPEPSADDPGPSTAPEEQASPQHRGNERKNPWSQANIVTVLVLQLFLYAVAVVLWVSRFEPGNSRHWAWIVLPVLAVVVVLVSVVGVVLVLQWMAELDLGPSDAAKTAAGHWTTAAASALFSGYLIVLVVGTDITWDARWGRACVIVALTYLWAETTVSRIRVGGMRRFLGVKPRLLAHKPLDEEPDDQREVTVLAAATSAVVRAAVFAAGAFAAVTYAVLRMSDTALYDSAGSPTGADPLRLMWFYLWHLANALPGR